MGNTAVSLIVALCCAAGVAVPAHGADPLASLQRFSDFPKIDVRQLMAGEILAQRGQLMEFPNGIATQTCFFVPAPPADTARRLQSWDPARCEPLNVYVSRSLSNPCGPSDFSDLKLDRKRRPVTWLLDKTHALASGKTDLNLTQAEVREMTGCAGKSAPPQAVSGCWSTVLQKRAASFQKQGVAGVLPYETGGETISSVAMVRAMLQEHARISCEFAPLLQKAGMEKAGPGTSPVTPHYYWSFFDADHHATLSLGAVYQSATDDYYQLLDFQYYVSGNYYTGATLFAIWPIQAGGKSGSLVWRGDFFAARLLRFTKGMERIAYGALMIQEIKKDIRCFLNAVKTNQ